jgi:hypothetical protein
VLKAAPRLFYGTMANEAVSEHGMDASETFEFGAENIPERLFELIGQLANAGG